MSAKPRLNLDQIAAAISAHLKRMEQDGDWNQVKRASGVVTPKVFEPGVWSTGKRVMVRYITYQPAIGLTRDQSLRYLAWLDGGGRGNHIDMEREREVAS